MNPPIDEAAALKELVARGLKIPPWPKVLLELQEAIKSGNANVRGVARIIGQDPGLAAMLFKVANSPVIVKGKKDLTRLDQILQILGTRQIFQLIQAVALTTAITSANRKAFDAFWRRSAEIADLAALIAGEMVESQVAPEQAYMAGIFRECGIPVLMQRFPDYCEHIVFEQAQCGPTIHAEDRRFNVDHSSIGYLVARHWKLPDFVALAILHHCEMPRHELGAVRTVVAILHLANHCYNHLRHVETVGWGALHDEVFAELGIHDDEADFLARIEERYNATA